MKQKMSLLQEGILRAHENSYGMLFKGTAYTKAKEKQLLNFIQEDERQRDSFIDILMEHGCEYYWGGIIDGFRLCYGLLKELEGFESTDFLQDLLVQKSDIDEDGLDNPDSVEIEE